MFFNKKKQKQSNKKVNKVANKKVTTNKPTKGTAEVKPAAKSKYKANGTGSKQKKNNQIKIININLRGL